MADKVEAKKTDKQAVKRKVEFSNPYVLKVVPLSTTPAQLVYETAFDECAVSMRNLSSVLPTLVKNPSEMMAVNGAVDHLINNALAELRKEAAQIQKIADDNGIEMGKLNYTNVVQASAKLTCHKAGQYLQIITELDELICLVHSAWFAGFIADDAKSSMERKWRRKAIGVAAEIKNITNRAFKAHNNKNIESEPDDAALLGESSAGGSDAAATTEKPKRVKKATEKSAEAVAA
ncbi:MAG: hypothetical protein FD121_1112 [Gallionellaceae bacterium]|nr:MAG: hypothetical protein FD121_1112 [Gallionellaceae bacterium]